MAAQIFRRTTQTKFAIVCTWYLTCVVRPRVKFSRWRSAWGPWKRTSNRPKVVCSLPARSWTKPSKRQMKAKGRQSAEIYLQCIKPPLRKKNSKSKCSYNFCIVSWWSTVYNLLYIMYRYGECQFVVVSTSDFANSLILSYFALFVPGLFHKICSIFAQPI